jgi:tetratricopeptide (TPR) repeat protein
MKLISKITTAAAGLVFVGSSVFAQSLADAKKAIDAEQYQKAKSMLKNLTVTQADKDENHFYLGWVYLVQDYTDSAKVAFNKGVSINPKSALNFAGLGAAAHIEKDANGAKTNFDKAVSLAGKDSKPYTYIGKGYLLGTPDANSAISVLIKGATVNAKDPELLIALGDAYRSQLKSNEAYKSYSDALALDPKSPAANTAIGVLWKFANNFEDSEKQYKAALAIDPNYGPAYREWAETDARWALTEPKMASAKIKEAVDQYRKFLSLTDMSIESRLRYADFLTYAGDYKALQQEAAALAQSANTNARVYRYLAYAAYENKDYPAALTAMNKFMQTAGEKRIIPRDYLYLGRIQIANTQDSLGIQSLQKAYSLDTTQADVYSEIAKSLYAQKKYKQAGDAYNAYLRKSRKGTLNDYLREGMSYFYAYDNARPDTTLLTKADSAFSYIEQKATTPIPAVILYRAYVYDTKDADRQNIKGLAKPFYEKYIQAITTKGVTDADKKSLASAYAYLGTYYEFKEKDDAKAVENYTKARETDPTNKQAQNYFQRRGAKSGAAKGK